LFNHFFSFTKRYTKPKQFSTLLFVSAEDTFKATNHSAGAIVPITPKHLNILLYPYHADTMVDSRTVKPNNFVILLWRTVGFATL
jgi:hypothetical protein